MRCVFVFIVFARVDFMGIVNVLNVLNVFKGLLTSLTFWGVVFVVALVLWLYAPALHNGLVWDDNSFLKGQAYYWVPDLWSNALTEHFLLSMNYYRPMVVASFLLDAHVWTGTDATYHASNIAAHVVACVVVFGLLHHLCRRANVAGHWALVGSLLYGCSPILSEVVLWVSGRFDLFLSLFLLLTLYSDVVAKGRSRLFLIALFYFFAACSKEMAVAFGLLYPLWHWYLARLEADDTPLVAVCLRRENVLAYCAVILGGLAYLGLRYYSLGALYTQEELVHPKGHQSVTGLILVMKTLGGYCSAVLGFASNISPIYPLPKSVSWLDGDVLLGIVFSVLTIILLLVRSVWGLVFSVFLVSLLPVLNIIPLNIVGNYMHLRFLAFPYALVLLLTLPLLIRFLQGAGRLGAVSLVLFLFIVCVGGLSIRSVIPMWSSNTTFWTWADKQYPEYPLAKVNLMSSMVGQRQYQNSITLGEALLEADMEPSHRAVVRGGLAEAYFRTGQVDEMERQYELIFAEFGIAELRSGHYSKLYAAFAFSLMHVRPEEAAIDSLLTMALQFDQYNGLAWFLKGVIHAQESEYEKALEFIERGFLYMLPTARVKSEALLYLFGLATALQEHGLIISDESVALYE